MVTSVCFSECLQTVCNKAETASLYEKHDDSEMAELFLRQIGCANQVKLALPCIYAP